MNRKPRFDVRCGSGQCRAPSWPRAAASTCCSRLEANPATECWRSRAHPGASTSGTGTLRRDPVDLSLLVADVIDSVCEPREGDRVVTALDDSVVVEGSEVHLRSALTNLIRNALDHSPPGSAVYVSLVKRA